MAKTDWFRRTTWTEADQADFEARLKRARNSKAQFLRIQALYLQYTKSPELIRAALQLLDRLIAEYPNDQLQIATAYTQRAECLIALGREDDAVTAYRASLMQQRQFPHVKDDACLSFGEHVIAHQRRELYDEVLSGLADFDASLFPVLQYRLAVVRCLIAADRGDRALAREWARAALAAAAQDHSGLQYHQQLGLVTSVDAKIRKRLEQLSE